MSDSKDLCPINTSGDHRYFVFKTVEVFEPITDEEYLGGKYGLVYTKTEYAILGCNCGSVIKTEVNKR